MKAPPGYERIDLRFNSRKRMFVPDLSHFGLIRVTPHGEEARLRRLEP